MTIDRQKLIFLDGAMGTMLQRKGLQPGENPELMNLEHPEWIRDIHGAYAAAGSQVVYANTFGANSIICCSNRSMLLPAARATTSNSPFLSRTISNVWVPIDPVDPRTAILFITFSIPSSFCRHQSSLDRIVPSASIYK